MESSSLVSGGRHVRNRVSCSWTSIRSMTLPRACLGNQNGGGRHGRIGGVDAFLNFLGQFATIFAAVAAAVPFGVSFRNWYMKCIGSRRELSRRLGKMAVGVALDYVKSLFGTPLMQRDTYNVAGSVDYIFMTDHAWIVVRIRGGEVLAWSITVTDKWLKVNLRDLTFGLVKGKLGRSRFADVVEQPSGVRKRSARSAMPTPNAPTSVGPRPTSRSSSCTTWRESARSRTAATPLWSVHAHSSLKTAPGGPRAHPGDSQGHDGQHVSVVRP
jgi:hypothetical protein